MQEPAAHSPSLQSLLQQLRSLSSEQDGSEGPGKPAAAPPEKRPAIEAPSSENAPAAVRKKGWSKLPLVFVALAVCVLGFVGWYLSRRKAGPVGKAAAAGIGETPEEIVAREAPPVPPSLQRRVRFSEEVGVAAELPNEEGEEDMFSDVPLIRIEPSQVLRG